MANGLRWEKRNQFIKMYKEKTSRPDLLNDLSRSVLSFGHIESGRPGAKFISANWQMYSTPDLLSGTFFLSFLVRRKVSRKMFGLHEGIIKESMGVDVVDHILRKNEGSSLRDFQNQLLFVDNKKLRLLFTIDGELLFILSEVESIIGDLPNSRFRHRKKIRLNNSNIHHAFLQSKSKDSLVFKSTSERMITFSGLIDEMSRLSSRSARLEAIEEVVFSITKTLNYRKVMAWSKEMENELRDDRALNSYLNHDTMTHEDPNAELISLYKGIFELRRKTNGPFSIEAHAPLLDETQAVAATVTIAEEEPVPEERSIPNEEPTHDNGEPTNERHDFDSQWRANDDQLSNQEERLLEIASQNTPRFIFDRSLQNGANLHSAYIQENLQAFEAAKQSHRTLSADSLQRLQLAKKNHETCVSESYLKFQDAERVYKSRIQKANKRLDEIKLMAEDEFRVNLDGMKNGSLQPNQILQMSRDRRSAERERDLLIVGLGRIVEVEEKVKLHKLLAAAYGKIGEIESTFSRELKRTDLN